MAGEAHREGSLWWKSWGTALVLWDGKLFQAHRAGKASQPPFLPSSASSAFLPAASNLWLQENQGSLRPSAHGCGESTQSDIFSELQPVPETRLLYICQLHEAWGGGCAKLLRATRQQMDFGSALISSKRPCLRHIHQREPIPLLN